MSYLTPTVYNTEQVIKKWSVNIVELYEVLFGHSAEVFPCDASEGLPAQQVHVYLLRSLRYVVDPVYHVVVAPIFRVNSFPAF